MVAAQNTDGVKAKSPSAERAMSVADRGATDAARAHGPTRRPRWRVTTADRPRVRDSAAPSGLIQRGTPEGTAGLLMDRILVQTSAGAQLEAVLPYIDETTSGLVLSRGRMTNRTNLREIMVGLPERGFDAPVVFDPEGYRRHVATTAAPFHFERQDMLAETLDENLSDQRALGVDVALTPTGLIRADGIDALEVAAEQAQQLSRNDFIFTVPFDAAILDDTSLTLRVWTILNDLMVPVALILASQLDPFDSNAKRRISALRAFTAGPAHVAAFRTDFNAFDVMCHGGFAAAIGSGGSMRHAVDPDEQPKSINRDDESPSVLYKRLASWWRGSKIAAEYGRMPAPTCQCAACDGRRIDRFLSKDDSADARAHGVAVWQEWSKIIAEKESIADRGAFWKTFCQGRIAEYEYLSQELRRAKPLRPRPAFSAWAELPA
ncbi:hypothetical protein H7J93_16495 [Mycobacterium barrassiae]|uniref:hypothetical protein n=1 Tax=Mycobacterium barrassiae TaxID=319709 RepID=UPI002265C3EA|nr:hypothetical protein [Mycobacterium barrassiae]MCV7301220.1 hypothetical protein [Mycobacterium barrassiae]